MKTKTSITGLLSVAALLCAGSAAAARITPDLNPDPTACDLEGADRTCWRVNAFPPSQPSLSTLADLVGIDEEGLSILYKDETDGKNPGEESGSFAGNYSTEFLFDPEEAEEESYGANITWDGGSFISCLACYLWVKDGPHTPSYYVFDISWWDGMETLMLDGFWPRQGAISNIGIFGREGGDMQVPAPGTLALLGIAAVGLGLARRRRQG